MKNRLYTCVTFIYLLVLTHAGYSQDQEAVTATDKVLHFPSTLFGKLHDKAALLNKALDKQRERC